MCSADWWTVFNGTNADEKKLTSITLCLDFPYQQDMKRFRWRITMPNSVERNVSLDQQVTKQRVGTGRSFLLRVYNWKVRKRGVARERDWTCARSCALFPPFFFLPVEIEDVKWASRVFRSERLKKGLGKRVIKSKLWSDWCYISRFYTKIIFTWMYCVDHCGSVLADVRTINLWNYLKLG